MSHVRMMAAILLMISGCDAAPRKPAMSEAESLYRKGARILDQKGDTQEAIEYLTKSIALEPDSARVLHRRIFAYASLGRDAEAVADAKRLEAIEPEAGRKVRQYLTLSAAPYTDIGNRELEAGKPAEAIKYYESALTYDPSFADAWVCKGIAFKRLGRDAESLECFSKAIELEPDNYYAFANRAALHHDRKRLEAALADYTKAIELSPGNPDPYTFRAEVYSELQMPDKAAADTARASELEQDAK